MLFLGTFNVGKDVRKKAKRKVRLIRVNAIFLSLKLPRFIMKSLYNIYTNFTSVCM